MTDGGILSPKNFMKNTKTSDNKISTLEMSSAMPITLRIEKRDKYDSRHATVCINNSIQTLQCITHSIIGTDFFLTPASNLVT